jgi:hypothetical protein
MVSLELYKLYRISSRPALQEVHIRLQEALDRAHPGLQKIRNETHPPRTKGSPTRIKSRYLDINTRPVTYNLHHDVLGGA